MDATHLTSSDDDIFITQNTSLQSLESRENYNPIISDISDEELVSTCEAIEITHSMNKTPNCVNPDKADSNRFPNPKSDEEVKVMGLKRFCTSTRRKCDWAVRLFNDWKVNRNQNAIMNATLNISAIRCELVEMTDDELCYSLTRFVLEVRKKNGDEFPPQTLYEIVICIQLYLSMYARDVKFFDDKSFVSLKNTVDSRMKELSSCGKVTPIRKAEITTRDEEDLLWSKSLLGDDTPQQLLDTVLYLLGIHFALTAGKEHKQLRYGDSSQIKIKVDPISQSTFLEYTEDVSKNRQGGLKHRKITPKIVTAYTNKMNPNRCVVRLYEKYIGLRPTDAGCSRDLYLRPLQKPKENVWYTCQPLGIHKITRTVSRLCQAVGLQGFRSNHSLRATAASRMYNDKMDEQLICERTGHRSNSVRSYKRTSTGQLKAISDVLYGNNVQYANSVTSEPKCVSEIVVTQNLPTTSAVLVKENESDANSDVKATVSINISINIPK